MNRDSSETWGIVAILAVAGLILWKSGIFTATKSLSQGASDLINAITGLPNDVSNLVSAISNYQGYTSTGGGINPVSSSTTTTITPSGVATATDVSVNIIATLDYLYPGVASQYGFDSPQLNVKLLSDPTYYGYSFNSEGYLTNGTITIIPPSSYVLNVKNKLGILTVAQG